ncbi:alpha/beta fold hydrolase [Nocardia sp. ET3-3]|uniref:Alpha/beta fold hydrolase n=1 Tax=Nocardia terrae TaxID=2675851 RepID=A0A7K1V7T0_9NOCA|nr:alpha/beta hydrolase [Nocardia terrae]MVU82522.1 alpha/beta fold hydrolase [Nocardia terrae]
MRRRAMLQLGAGAFAAVGAASAVTAWETTRPADAAVPDDAELARALGDFRSDTALVNGFRMHYVTGGSGDPVVLVPGWPTTWWSYRKIMPALAQRYRVVAVDIRGMGGSDKPSGGFDKKTMAGDIHELIRTLGFDRVHLVGHDIGSMVAFSFAANHPDATRSLSLLDVLHPDDSFYRIPMLQPPGSGVSVWWYAFNQVQSLPEKLLAGRARELIDWHLGIGLVDQATITDFDRAVVADRYNRPGAVRCANAWYQGFHQDIIDMRAYPELTAPTLGLCSPIAYPAFQQTLPKLATDLRDIIEVDKARHWLCDEDPDLVIRSLTTHFAATTR